MTRTSPTRTASLLLGAARVGLGALWLNEGLFKLSAHFGRADIVLVGQSALSNSRVPGFFQWFAEHVLLSVPDLLGVVIPLLEAGLGLALILGVLTLPAALGSVLQLLTYWLADQLVWQYPVMMLLAVLVVAWPQAASRYSVTTLAVGRLATRPTWEARLAGPLRDWL